MSQRFSITPAKAAADKDLTDSIHRTLSVIGVYGDKNGWCWPSHSTLAEIRGVSRQTIISHIKTLIERGYINTQPRFDETTGAQQSNMMQVKFDFEFDTPVKPKTLHPLSSPRLDTPCKPQDFTHNALLNDPLEREVEEEKKPEIFTLYEKNIGPITQLISDELIDASKRFHPEWIEVAFIEAVKANVRKWKYVYAILDRWEREGFQADSRPAKNGKPKKDYNKAGEDWLAKRRERQDA